MESLFRAARQNRIFHQIQEAIIDGRLAAGDKLPAERDLKEMLQTSRSTLREALRVLEQKGLIEIRLGVGGGSVVKAVSADQVTESLDLLIRSQKVSLKHLAEFREGVEGDVVAIAAQRAVEADHIRLDTLLNKAQECVRRGAGHLDDFLKADRDLHLEFAKITHNPVYISVLKTIHHNIDRYFERFLTMEDQEMLENLQDLEHIVQAVKQRRSNRARQLAKLHVQRFYGYMRKQEDSQAEQLALSAESKA